MRRLGWILALAVIPACGGRQSSEAYVAPPEEVQFCDTILVDLHRIDLNTADEATLETSMVRAEEAADRCEVLLETPDPAEQLIAAHRVRGLQIHSLWFEAALSRRFDDYAGYCEILGEAFNLLAQGVLELDAALADRDSLSVSSEIELRELRDLDLEALDVLYLGIESHCD